MQNAVAIRVEMAKRNMNISELAKVSGVTRATIHKILNGENVSVKTLSKLAEALGVDTAVFFKAVV